MKAGWKNRMDERIYFENKKKEWRDLVIAKLSMQHELETISAYESAMNRLLNLEQSCAGQAQHST